MAAPARRQRISADGIRLHRRQSGPGALRRGRGRVRQKSPLGGPLSITGRNACATAYNNSLNLAQLFDLSLVGRRDRPALEFQGATYTFGDIDARSNRLAQRSEEHTSEL